MRSLFLFVKLLKQVKTCIATLYDKLKETKTFSLLRSKAALIYGGLG